MFIGIRTTFLGKSFDSNRLSSESRCNDEYSIFDIKNIDGQLQKLQMVTMQPIYGDR